MTKWVPVKGFEKHYEVSDDGQVRRTSAYRTTHVGKVLTPVIRGSGRGYYEVNLSVGGARFQRRVHRLMAESFGAPGEGAIVRHLDDDRFNNTLANLSWGTPQDNTDDAIANGAFVPAGYPVRPLCKNGHEFTPENTFVRHDSGRGCRACRKDIAARYRAKKIAASS